jgi:putative Mg2+ transporter-C (MgtC) family protein
MSYISEYFFHFDFILKCLLSLALGGLIGLEREFKHKPAGIKTHVLICVGATILAFLSSKFSHDGDPGRIAAQIVSGIGFIGAGTILQSKQVVQGLTTAATLWVAAAIGMLVGAGYFMPSILVTAIIVPFMIFTNYIPLQTRLRYVATIEIKKLKSLEKIEAMINTFDLIIYKKNLVKKDRIYLELQYSATPLTNHIFLKRLFETKGLGTIIKI